MIDQSRVNFECDLATTANMVFDEVIFSISDDDDDNAANRSKSSLSLRTTNCMESIAMKKCVSRGDSPIMFDDKQQAHSDKITVPDVAPVSPCFSEDSSSSPSSAMSITGKSYSNIEYIYHIDPRVLGSGHHGSVRECIHRTTGRRYAVKSINKHAAGIGSTGLLREVSLLKEMKHRGFVRLVDVHEDEDYVHLVTDLCRGGELFDRIMQKVSNRSNGGSPCFTEPEAARIMYQLLDAIAYMHEMGVAHRDIKPENIMFETKSEDSLIKIIDFGLSRKHYDCDPPMSNVVGTPYYIAPEVLSRSFTKKCDLWSAGVIAYILLCGYPPFNGDDNEAVYDAIRRGLYSFPVTEWSGTSREARHFIRCLLLRDPRKRLSALQALNHPWIVKHVGRVRNVEDDRHDFISSVEVVYDQLSERRSVVMVSDS